MARFLEQQAKSREISNGIAQLAFDVQSASRNAQRRGSGGYTAGVGGSSQHLHEVELELIQKFEAMKRAVEQNAADRIESMMKKHQEEYCRAKDAHFEQKQRLEEELHLTKKKLHVATNELETVQANYRELQMLHLDSREASMEMSNLHHILKGKDNMLARMEAEASESEAQIMELRRSLEEAIRTIQKQHRDNKELQRRLEKRGAALGDAGRDERRRERAAQLREEAERVARAKRDMEEEVRQLRQLAAAPPGADLAAVLQLIAEKIEQAKQEPPPPPSPPPPPPPASQPDPEFQQRLEEKTKLASDLEAQLKNLQKIQKRTASDQSRTIDMLRDDLREAEEAAKKVSGLEAELRIAKETQAELLAADADRKREEQQLEANLKLLREENDGLRTRALTLEADMKAVKAEGLRAQLSEKPIEEELAAEAEVLKRNVSFLEGQVKTLQEENDELRTAQQQLRADMEGLRAADRGSEEERAAKTETLKRSVSFLEGQVKTLQEENDELRTAQQQRQQLQEETDGLRAALQAARAGKEEEEAAATASKRNLAIIQQRVAQLEAQLQTARSQTHQPAQDPQQQHDQQEMLLQCADRNMLLTTAHDSLTAAYKKRLLQLEILASRVKKLEGELREEEKKRTTRVQALKDQVSRTIAERNSLKNEVRDLTNELNRLRSVQ